MNRVCCVCGVGVGHERLSAKREINTRTLPPARRTSRRTSLAPRSPSWVSRWSTRGTWCIRQNERSTYQPAQKWPMGQPTNIRIRIHRKLQSRPGQPHLPPHMFLTVPAATALGTQADYWLVNASKNALSNSREYITAHDEEALYHLKSTATLVFEILFELLAPPPRERYTQTRRVSTETRLPHSSGFASFESPQSTSRICNFLSLIHYNTYEYNVCMHDVRCTVLNELYM